MRVQEVQFALYSGGAMFQPAPEVCHQPEHIQITSVAGTGIPGSDGSG